MNGYDKRADSTSPKLIVEELALKNIPKRKVVANDGIEYLLNINHEILFARSASTKHAIAAVRTHYIPEDSIVQSTTFYENEESILQDTDALRNCWNELSDWWNREYYK